MNIDIQPTLDDIRKMADAKRPKQKQTPKPRAKQNKKKIPLAPLIPEPAIIIEPIIEPIIETEKKEDIVIPSIKPTPEIADNQLELIKYILDNSNDRTKKELNELKEYISSQQKNILDVFNSLKPNKPKPKPKPKTKPTKVLDLTISDKEIELVMNPPTNKTETNKTDTNKKDFKLQAFLDALKK